MRNVYVIDFTDDATGVESREVFGTRARARAYLRAEGFKLLDGESWVRLDDEDEPDFGLRAFIQKEQVQ